MRRRNKFSLIGFGLASMLAISAVAPPGGSRIMAEKAADDATALSADSPVETKENKQNIEIGSTKKSDPKGVAGTTVTFDRSALSAFTYDSTELFNHINMQPVSTTNASLPAESLPVSPVAETLPEAFPTSTQAVETGYKGMAVSLAVKREKINVLTADGDNNILEGVQNDVTEG